jgi:hypothetical protein
MNERHELGVSGRLDYLAEAITEREVQTKRQVGALHSPPYNSSDIQADVVVNLNRLCR